MNGRTLGRGADSGRTDANAGIVEGDEVVLVVLDGFGDGDVRLVATLWLIEALINLVSLSAPASSICRGRTNTIFAPKPLRFADRSASPVRSCCIGTNSRPEFLIWSAGSVCQVYTHDAAPLSTVAALISSNGVLSEYARPRLLFFASAGARKASRGRRAAAGTMLGKTGE